jgi:hypothetical protein
VASILMGSVFALLGLGYAAEHNGPRLFGIGLLICGLVFSYRGYLSATVLVSADTVVTRSFLRSRTYSVAELTAVDVVVGRTGMNGSGREFIVLEMTDGSRREFTELNSPPARATEQPTVVRQAAEAIVGALRS